MQGKTETGEEMVTSLRLKHNFDLKARLPEEAYQFAWQRVDELPGKELARGDLARQ